MRPLMIFIVLFISAAFFYKSAQSITQARDYGQRAQHIDAKIRQMGQEKANLARYKDREGGALSDNYRMVYDLIRRIAIYQDVAVMLSIDGHEHGEGIIQEQSMESPLKGVRMLPVKASFSHVMGFDNYFVLLDQLAQVEQKYPLEITRIEHSGQMIEFIFNVYGI